MTEASDFEDRRATPDLIRAASFAPARLGRRGVDEGQVRDFCGWVADELVRLLTERTTLEAEVLRLRDLAVSRAPQPADGEARAVSILSQAQRTADQYVASAQAYGRDLAADARRHREEIVSQARTRAAAILDDAHAQAARAAAELPPPAAAASPDPAAREADEARRRELEAELAYLRTFSQVCRTHLRAYLESLTRGIDEWERAEAGAAAEAMLAARAGDAARARAGGTARADDTARAEDVARAEDTRADDPARAGDAARAG